MAREASLHPISEKYMRNDCGLYTLLACRKQLIRRANRWCNFLGRADFCDHGGELKGSSPYWCMAEMKLIIVRCSSPHLRQRGFKVAVVCVMVKVVAGEHCVIPPLYPSTVGRYDAQEFCCRKFRFSMVWKSYLENRGRLRRDMMRAAWVGTGGESQSHSPLAAKSFGRPGIRSKQVDTAYHFHGVLYLVSGGRQSFPFHCK
ncbi:hypothetical protein TNCV_1353371 [Trichonephila clavipes]|nr:hypothetical protein TNCV_1353371 [Trichonephila clavipes]